MPNLYKTIDNENFSVPGVSPSQINQLVWQGLPGKYIAAAVDGLYTTVDGGVTWGKLYPNTPFGTTLPVGAVPNQIAFSIGPNGGANCAPFDECAIPVALNFSTPDYEGRSDSVGDINQYYLTAIDQSYKGMIFWVTSKVTSGVPNIPTVVDTINTVAAFELINTVVFGTSRLTLFQVANYDINSGSFGSALIRFNGQIQEEFVAGLLVLPYREIRITNHNIASGIGTTATAHLPNFSASGSTLMIVGSNSAGVGGTGNGTLNDVQRYFATNLQGEVFWQAGENNDPSVTLPVSDDWGAIALEVVGCAVDYAYGISFIALLPGNSGPGGASFNNIDGQGLYFQQEFNNNANGPLLYSAIKEGNNAWGNVATNFYALDEVNVGVATSIPLFIQTVNADDVIFVTVVAHLVPAGVNPTISDSKGLTWTLMTSHGPPAGLYMYTWTAKSNAAVVATGSTVTINYAGAPRNAITALAVGLKNAVEPNVATVPIGIGAFAGSGSGTENTIVNESTGGFSPELDHTWGMNDFTQSLAIALGVQ